MSEAVLRRSARNPTAFLRRAERNRQTDEVRHDQTRQRKFERGFLSLDMPDSLAARADWSDMGYAVRRLLNALDDPFRRLRREACIRRAAARLPRTSVWLQPLLWGIYRNGPERERTMAELGIPERTYWWGLKFFLDFFSVNV